MKLIVGLGNPTSEYANTRHNIGFMALDFIISKNNITKLSDKFQAKYAKSKIGNEDVIFFFPQTYMNLSGNAIYEIVKFYKIDLKDILVIYDDKDLPFAALRLKEKGNPGSHNGMINITNMLQSTNFARLRIGIGSPTEGALMDYVLSKFKKEELDVLNNETFIKVYDAVNFFINGNFDKAMTLYNRNEKNN